MVETIVHKEAVKNMKKEKNPFSFTLVLVILICSPILIFWWIAVLLTWVHGSINHLYKEMKRQNEPEIKDK